MASLEHGETVARQKLGQAVALLKKCRQGEGVCMFVNAREGESFEELYRRFKRGMEASGILREYRRKQRFKPAHEERRDKIRAAGRKLRRAMAKRPS